MLLLCALGLLGWPTWEAVTWPDVVALAHRAPSTTAFIEPYTARQRAARTDYPRTSPNLERAVLVAEDVDFFSHDGFDWGEIKTAVEESLGEQETARADSTITSSS